MCSHRCNGVSFAALSFFLLLPACSGAIAGEFWYVSGNRIYDEQGRMVTIRAFCDDYSNFPPIRYDPAGNFIDDEDNRRRRLQFEYKVNPDWVAEMARNGYNTVRMRFHYLELLQFDQQDPANKVWRLRDGMLEQLEERVNMYGNAGLKVILVGAKKPGGENAADKCWLHDPPIEDENHYFDRTPHAGDDWGITENLAEGSWTVYHATRFIFLDFWVWEQIAAYFWDNPNVLGYEICGEPHFYLYQDSPQPTALAWPDDMEQILDQADMWYKILETRIYEAENAAAGGSAPEHHIVIRQFPYKYGDYDGPWVSMQDAYYDHIRSGLHDPFTGRPNLILSVHQYRPGDFHWLSLGDGGDPEIYPSYGDTVYDRDRVSPYNQAHGAQEDPDVNYPFWLSEQVDAGVSAGPKEKVGAGVNRADNIRILEDYWDTPLGGWTSWGSFRIPGSLTTALARNDVWSAWRLEWDKDVPSAQDYLHAPENAARPPGVEATFWHHLPDAINNIENPFPEDFSDGETILSGWTEDATAPVGGASHWSVRDGWYHVEYSGAASSDYASSRAGLNDWMDYSCTGRFKLAAGSTALLMVRALSSKDFYALKATQGTSDNVRVIKVCHGTEENIGTPASETLEAGGAYEFEIHVSGSGADVTIDWDIAADRPHSGLYAGPDVSLHSVTDTGSSSIPVPRGRVGVGLYGASGAADFDDLNVVEDDAYYTDFEEHVFTAAGFIEHVIDVGDRGSFVLDFRIRHDSRTNPGTPAMGVRFRRTPRDSYVLQFAQFPADVGLHGGIRTERKYSYLKLFEITGGVRTQVANTFAGNSNGTPFDIYSDEWYRVRLICRDIDDGNACAVEVYVNDMQSPIIEYYDKSPRPAGAIGIFGFGGGAANTFRYSDVRLRRYHYLFEDRFNRASIGDAWTTQGGDWSEADGYLQGSSGGLGAIVVGPRAGGGSEWADYRMTGRLRILDDASDAAYVVLRMVSDKDFYAVQFDASSDTVRVLRFNNGSATPLHAWSRPLDLDTWYDFDVRVQGRDAATKFEVRIDGALVGMGAETDPSGSLDHERGSAGFGVNGSTARYDDLEITRDPFLGGASGDAFDDGKLDGWRVIAGKAEIDPVEEVLRCYADDTNGPSLVAAGDVRSSFHTIEGEATLPADSSLGFTVFIHLRDGARLYALQCVEKDSSPDNLVVGLTSRVHNWHARYPQWWPHKTDLTTFPIASDGHYYFRLTTSEAAGGGVKIEAWLDTDGAFDEGSIVITDVDDDYYTINHGLPGVGAAGNSSSSVKFDNVRIY